MTKRKFKIRYKPLENLLKNKNPTLDEICDTLKRAAKKNVDISYPELDKEYDLLFRRASLSPADFKHMYETIKSCIESLETRKKFDAATGYEVLSVYAYHKSI